MGQQQILLIVLSVILVGIAIAVGINMFQAQAQQSNVDNMVNDLNNLASNAYQYYIRPQSMGGGGNDWDPNGTTPEGVVTYLHTLPGWTWLTEGGAVTPDASLSRALRNDVAVYVASVKDVVLVTDGDAEEVVMIYANSIAYEDENERWVTVTDRGSIRVWTVDPSL